MVFFSSELISALKDITKGVHDDEECLDYYQSHQMYFQSVPKPCLFKNNQEQIPKLLEKITLPNMKYSFVDLKTCVV